eukprot:gene8656-34108_t
MALIPIQRRYYQKTLVLDLDHTLIDTHHISKPTSGKPDYIYTDSAGVQAKVFLRPFVREFLEKVREHFEIVLFTAAPQRHADAVLKFLDPTRSIFEHRLYMQHTSPSKTWPFVKDLSRLGRELSQTMLVLPAQDVRNAIYRHYNNGTLSPRPAPAVAQALQAAASSSEPTTKAIGLDSASSLESSDSSSTEAMATVTEDTDPDVWMMSRASSWESTTSDVVSAGLGYEGIGALVLPAVHSLSAPHSLEELEQLLCKISTAEDDLAVPDNLTHARSRAVSSAARKDTTVAERDDGPTPAFKLMSIQKAQHQLSISSKSAQQQIAESACIPAASKLMLIQKAQHQLSISSISAQQQIVESACIPAASTTKMLFNPFEAKPTAPISGCVKLDLNKQSKCLDPQEWEWEMKVGAGELSPGEWGFTWDFENGLHCLSAFEGRSHDPLTQDDYSALQEAAEKPPTPLEPWGPWKDGPLCGADAVGEPARKSAVCSAFDSHKSTAVNCPKGKQPAPELLPMTANMPLMINSMHQQSGFTTPISLSIL